MRSVVFLVRRLIVRERTRTVTALAVAASVIFLLTSALVVFNTIARSTEQKNASLLGSDVDLNTPLAPAHASAKATAFAEDLFRTRYGADTRFAPSIQANGIEVSTPASLTAGSPDGGATADAVSDARFGEFDMHRLDPSIAYDLVGGRYPTAAGEVTVSPSIADRLHVGVGSEISVALSRHPLKVVGLARPRSVHSTPLVLAATGTWARDIAGAPGVVSLRWLGRDLFVTIPARARELLRRDFAAGLDDAPYAHRLEDHAVAIGAARAAPGHGFRTFWVKHTVAFTLPIVALLAAIVVGQSLLRLRRDVHLIGSLQALGFTRHQTTAVLSLASLVPALVGTAIGLLLGLGLTLPWRVQIAALADTDPSSNPTPWRAILLGIAFFILLTAAGIAVLTARAARREALAAESVQFAERLVVQRSIAPLAGVGIALALAAAAWWVLKPPNGNSGLIRAALLCATLVALVPLLLVGVGRRIPPRYLTGWLAVRMTRSEIARMVGIVGIAGFGLGAPLGLVMLQSSYTATALATYRPSIPAGQVVVWTRHPLGEAGGRALDAAAGSSGIVQPTLGSLEDDVWASPNAGGRWLPLFPSPVTIVTDRRVAGVDLGWDMPDKDWRAIVQGKVLWLDPETRPRRGTVTFATYGAGDHPHVLGHAAAVLTSGTPSSTAFNEGGAVMSQALATRLGLHESPAWRRYPDAVDHLAAITKAATVAGIVTGDVRVDPGPDIAPVPMSFKAGLLVGLLLVAMGVFLIIAPSGREIRATNRTLHTLGYSQGAIRRLHLITTLTPLLLGVAIGVVAGLGVFLADFLKAAGVAQIPWAQIGMATGAILLVGLVAIAFSWLNLLRSSAPGRTQIARERVPAR